MDDKLEAKLAFTKNGVEEAQRRHQQHQNLLTGKRTELNSLLYQHNIRLEAIKKELLALEGQQLRQVQVEVEVAKEFFEAAKAELEKEKAKAEARAKGLTVA